MDTMSSTEDASLRTQLLQLECYFTWALRKEDTDLTNLLNRLEVQTKLGSKEEAGRTYNYLGFVKFLFGLNDEALIYFHKSVEISKENQEHEDDKLYCVAYGNLAWLHYHMKAYEECKRYLTKVQKIKDKHPPASATAPYANVIGEKGWVFLKFSHNYYDRAKECFKKALELEPDEGDWNAGLAILLSRTETELTSPTESPAIQQMRRAIELNPDDDVLKVLLGLKLSIYKEHKEAESLIKTALEKSPEHPHVMRYVGKFFRQNGLEEKSISLLKQALEKNPDSAFIHHQLAICYKNQITELYHRNRNSEIQHMRNQCINHLERSITLNASFILAMCELALQYGHNKDIEKAKEMFQKIFKTAKEKNDGQQLVHLFYADFCQHHIGSESLAIEHYTECLKINANTVEGRRGAKSLKAIAKRRIRENPQDGEAFGILGFIQKEQGDKLQALRSYEKALIYVNNDEYLSNLCELRLSLQ